MQKNFDGEEYWPETDDDQYTLDQWRSADDEDWYDESTCCYDPSYRYGTYCHCAAQAKQEWLESKWWYRLWVWSRRIADKPGMWYRQWKRKRFVYSATCDECDHTWKHRGSQPPCPNCGYQGLPF